MSKFFNLTNAAITETSVLMEPSTIMLAGTTNPKVDSTTSFSKVMITNTSANAVKVSLYTQQDTVTVLAADYQASGDATITHTANADIEAGMTVSSNVAGIPPGATVATVGDGSVTTFELSTDTTVDQAGTATLTLGIPHYIIKDIEIPAGVTLVLDDEIAFQMRVGSTTVTSRKLVILKTNINTTITVTIN